MSSEDTFGFVRTDFSSQVHLSQAYWGPLYDTLFIRTTAPDVEANVATDWSYNDELTELTIDLRPGIEFTDGTALDAEVVRDNLLTFRDGGGGEASLLALVEDVTAVDADTLTISLSAPDPNLLINLSGTAGAVFAASGLDSSDKAAIPAGSGPYLVDESRTVTGSTHTYVRNPDYWNPERYPYDEIVLKPMLDVSARINALKSGEVDGAAIPQTAAADATASGLTIVTGIANWAGLHLVDREGAVVPALADVRVRQAINMIWDREAIVAAIFSDYGTPNNQIFAEGNQAHVAGIEDEYAYDIDTAKALMAEAGYADGFTMQLPVIIGNHDAVTPIIVQQLGLIGITAEPVPLQFGDFLNAVFGQQYGLFYLTHPTLNQAWYDIERQVMPTALWNVFKTSDPALNGYLEAAQTTSGAEQQAAFQQIGEFLFDNAWYAPWAIPTVTYATNSSIHAELSPSQVEPYLWDISPAE